MARRQGDPDRDRAGGRDPRALIRLPGQSRLTGVQPLEFSAIVDESVLHRVIGGQDVMENQVNGSLTWLNYPT